MVSINFVVIKLSTVGNYVHEIVDKNCAKNREHTPPLGPVYVGNHPRLRSQRSGLFDDSIVLSNELDFNSVFISLVHRLLPSAHRPILQQPPPLIKPNAVPIMAHSKSQVTGHS